MKNISYCALSLGASFLTSCSAIGGAWSGSYSESSIPQNIYIVEFDGNQRVDAKHEVDYALLRSAEVTTEKGFKYFIIVDERNPISRNNGYNIVKPSKRNAIVFLESKGDQNSYEAAPLVLALRKTYGFTTPYQE